MVSPWIQKYIYKVNGPQRGFSRSIATKLTLSFRFFANFPFFQVHDGEGQSVTTWKLWQIAAYLVFWWNFS